VLLKDTLAFAALKKNKPESFSLDSLNDSPLFVIARIAYFSQALFGKLSMDKHSSLFRQ
jgi:hypothetical protein